MVWSQNLRAKFLEPLLKVLSKAGVTANGLTWLSLFVGLAACPLYFVAKPLFLGLILLHVLIDGLDGPLARYKGTASGKGSFTDTFADQFVVTATTITLIYAKVIGAIPGASYIFLYTVVIAFSMVRNALNIPYSWLVRPRFIIYAWFIVEFYIFPGTINYVIWLFILLLLIKVITGFIKIHRKM